MNDSPLSTLQQNEWDAFILSILKPFYTLCKKDVLVNLEDLQQEAWIGLLAACDRYDPGRAKFTTYAYHYIRGHIMRYVAKKTKDKPTQVDEDPSMYIDKRKECSENVTADVECNDLITTILEKVSDQKDAYLLVEHYLKDKSFRQIARETGVSPEAISTRIHKLLDLLEIRLHHENA